MSFLTIAILEEIERLEELSHNAFMVSLASGYKKEDARKKAYFMGISKKAQTRKCYLENLIK